MRFLTPLLVAGTVCVVAAVLVGAAGSVGFGAPVVMQGVSAGLIAAFLLAFCVAGVLIGRDLDGSDR